LQTKNKKIQPNNKKHQIKFIFITYQKPKTQKVKALKQKTQRQKHPKKRK
jgi:hypothetical protein